MIYVYKIIDPYTQKVVGEGGTNFMNRRTIADAIRRQTGTVISSIRELKTEVNWYLSLKMKTTMYLDFI